MLTNRKPVAVAASVAPMSAMQTTQRRWQIRLEQLGQGGEPCFDSGTQLCEQSGCRWHRECQRLRAVWRR